eukprot:TRINITY_DN25_c0_g1_i11.p1 TRINITY_DN25_c0_g1~~TRINITY_DN25_c0_g1_i11.p1  ORF type:complete len:238 (-),score=12.92 TRINITY_DN25_c0_g1_i11:20-733(-)
MSTASTPAPRAAATATRDWLPRRHTMTMRRVAPAPSPAVSLPANRAANSGTAASNPPTGTLTEPGTAHSWYCAAGRTSTSNVAAAPAGVKYEAAKASAGRRHAGGEVGGQCRRLVRDDRAGAGGNGRRGAGHVCVCRWGCRRRRTVGRHGRGAAATTIPPTSTRTAARRAKHVSGRHGPPGRPNRRPRTARLPCHLPRGAVGERLIPGGGTPWGAPQARRGAWDRRAVNTQVVHIKE